MRREKSLSAVAGFGRLERMKHRRLTSCAGHWIGVITLIIWLGIGGGQVLGQNKFIGVTVNESYPQANEVVDIDLGTMAVAQRWPMEGRLQVLDAERFLVIRAEWVGLGQRGSADIETLYEATGQERVVGVLGTGIITFDQSDAGLRRYALTGGEGTLLRTIDYAVGVQLYQVTPQAIGVFEWDSDEVKLYYFDHTGLIWGSSTQPAAHYLALGEYEGGYYAAHGAVWEPGSLAPQILLRNGGQLMRIEDGGWLVFVRSNNTEGHIIERYDAQFNAHGETKIPYIGRLLHAWRENGADTLLFQGAEGLQKVQLAAPEAGSGTQTLALATAPRPEAPGLQSRFGSSFSHGNLIWYTERRASDSGVVTHIVAYDMTTQAYREGLIMPGAVEKLIPALDGERLLASVWSGHSQRPQTIWEIDIAAREARLVVRDFDGDLSGNWYAERFVLQGWDFAYAVDMDGKPRGMFREVGLEPLAQADGYAGPSGALYLLAAESGGYARVDGGLLDGRDFTQSALWFADGRHALVYPSGGGRAELIRVSDRAILRVYDNFNSAAPGTDGLLLQDGGVFSYLPTENPLAAIELGRLSGRYGDITEPNRAGGLTRYYSYEHFKVTYLQATWFDPRTTQPGNGPFNWITLDYGDWQYINELGFCWPLGDGWYWSANWGHIYLYAATAQQLTFHHASGAYAALQGSPNYLYDFGQAAWKLRYAAADGPVYLYDLNYAFWEIAGTDTAPDFVAGVRMRLQGAAGYTDEYWHFTPPFINARLNVEGIGFVWVALPYESRKEGTDTIVVTLQPDPSIGLLSGQYRFHFASKRAGTFTGELVTATDKGQERETFASSFNLVPLSAWPSQ